MRRIPEIRRERDDPKALCSFKYVNAGFFPFSLPKEDNEDVFGRTIREIFVPGVEEIHSRDKRFMGCCWKMRSCGWYGTNRSERS